jgi:uncharacterized membrane protein YgcG
MFDLFRSLRNFRSWASTANTTAKIVILFCSHNYCRRDRYLPRSERFHPIKIDCVANSQIRFSKFFAAANNNMFWLCAQQNILNFKEFLLNMWCSLRSAQNIFIPHFQRASNFLISSGDSGDSDDSGDSGDSGGGGNTGDSGDRGDRCDRW